MPRLGPHALGLEVEQLHLDCLLQRKALARRCCGHPVATTIEPREPVGILGGYGGGKGRPTSSRTCRGRSNGMPPLGAVTGHHDLPLGGLDAAQGGACAFNVVPLILERLAGLPVFKGSLAQPFQGSRYRSRPKSLLRSRSSQ